MLAFRFRPQQGTAPRSLSVTVAQYTPQAVLIANVEEARYDALVDEEGKALVRVRYAVRNNQRAFLGGDAADRRNALECGRRRPSTPARDRCRRLAVAAARERPVG